MMIVFFVLVLQSTWCTSAAQPPPPDGGGGSFTIIPVVLAGTFFLTGFALVSFRRQLGACLFGISVDGGGHVGGGRAPDGLTQEAIEGFPTYFYEDVKVHRAVDDELECAICLNQFQDHEVLRLMPECNHIFHPQCIDPWLHSQAMCPVCRKILEPSSSSITTQTQPLISSPIGVSEDDDHHAITMDPISPFKIPDRQCSDRDDNSIEPESTTPDQIDEPKVVLELASREDRFTLEIPEEARSKIESTLWRFAKASSGRRKYRSKTPESGRIELNWQCCEPDRISVSSLNRSWKSLSRPASIVSDRPRGDTEVSG